MLVTWQRTKASKYAAGETSTNQYFQGPTYWRAASRRATAIDVHHRILRRTGTNVSRDGARLPCRVTYSSLGTEYGSRYRLLGAKYILARGPRVGLGWACSPASDVKSVSMRDDYRLRAVSLYSSQKNKNKLTDSSTPRHSKFIFKMFAQSRFEKRGGGAESDSEAPLYRPAFSVFLCISETSVDCEA